MRSIKICSAILMLCTVSAAHAGEEACRRQMMPSPIESAMLERPVAVNNVITFAATPIYDSVGRSWVVRLLQPFDKRPATLTIVALRQRLDCNVYDVENRWEAELEATEYEAVTAKLVPLAMPSLEQFKSRKSGMGRIGGTGLLVEMRTQGWQVTRLLNYRDADGQSISSVIRKIVARNAPQAMLPASADWSSPR